jgi:regulatory protein
VKDKFRFNRWGKQKIAYMLRAKKIQEEIINRAFDEIEDDGYSRQLIKLLEDKARSMKAHHAFDKRSKLLHFALGRGFESGEIYKALKELGI